MNTQQKEMVRERADAAVRDLHHNARLPWLRELFGRSEEQAQAWIEGTCEFELERIQGGGAYGDNYARTLAAPCNAGKYKSERARAYYIAKGMRDMREERAKYARHERITEYGTLYTWGRGGATLAPDGLCGRPWRAEDHSIAECIELIQIVEAFNKYVTGWCASLPEQWREYCAEEDAEALRQKRAAAARKGKETRERRYWAARDVITK